MLSINFIPADTKENREIAKKRNIECNFQPIEPRKTYEETLNEIQKDADNILAKIGLTYIVNIYITKSETFFRINFYNKDGICVDCVEGDGELYQYLLYKRAKQLAKRKRLKKIQDNNIIENLILDTQSSY